VYFKEMPYLSFYAQLLIDVAMVTVEAAEHHTFYVNKCNE
jgi:hypothetical protein